MREDYYRHCNPEGNRALVDAIEIVIHSEKKSWRYTKEEYRAEKVLFAIITMVRKMPAGIIRLIWSGSASSA